MASAFDELTPDDAEYVRKRLLAGETMADIRATWVDESGKPTISVRKMREMRDEVFEPLIADPAKVKALASGPVLNPLAIIRYRQRPGRKPRMARPAPVQTEMFPA